MSRFAPVSVLVTEPHTLDAVSAASVPNVVSDREEYDQTLAGTDAMSEPTDVEAVVMVEFIDAVFVVIAEARELVAV